MNKLNILAIATLAFTMLTGCTSSSTPVREDSVAAQGMGSDAALINARRGRSDAQMSAAQEKQYDRQRRVSEKEMEYQDKQDERAHKQANRNIGTAASLMSIFK